MKKINYTILVMAITLLSSTFTFGQVRDSLTMGPGYGNDIFYSLENGEVASVDRTNWDIAFYTNNFSAGIVTNDGAGVELYAYPNGDTNSWATVDTSGISSWERLYNSTEIWEDGSFNQNSTGHPNYGWCWYNSTNHHLYGVELFVIRISDTVYKKLWIREKKTIDNIFIFTYANIDGSKQEDVKLEVGPYVTKNFVYYSLANNAALDREPEGKSWDILFTKWVDQVDDGEGGFSPYNVTGVNSNVNIGANEFYPAVPGFDDWSSMPFDSAKNKIGYDWKDFDFTEGWVVKDSNVYFVQNYEGDVYKLSFDWWDGAGSGDFALDKQLVSGVSVNEFANDNIDFQVFPNPATSHFTIRSSNDLDAETNVIIYDQTGRTVFNKVASSVELEGGLQMNDLNLTKGLYIITLTGNKYSGSQKLLVK